MSWVPDGVKPDATAPASGSYGPADIQSAYKIAGLSSGARTVAIVDAYGYPTAESDLATYRSYWGLPACTRASGCLKILDQNGGTRFPAKDDGWDTEQALDLDAVSAACPDCKIVLVQAKSASFSDLAAAENTAAAQPGVVAISNSYGGGDVNDSALLKGKPVGSFYNHPGIAVTASTGDDGYQGASYPASSSYVTAVGGTNLVKDSSARGWSETAWYDAARQYGTGSGCSAYNAALSAASSFDTGCAKRASADLSAVADPRTGLAIYTSALDSSTGQPFGWHTFGGTSLSSPLVASMFALANNVTGLSNTYPYTHAGSFNDVTSGSFWGTCPVTQWCNARTGWDGPTGVGTPNGIGGL